LSEDVIRVILARRRDLSRETVVSLIEKKKIESEGFLSEHGAAMLVAQDLNVEIERSATMEIGIKDLVTGLNDVTITGKVKAASTLQEFTRRDGGIGKALRFIIVDSTGEVSCVAWGREAERLANEQLHERTVSILHGYTREGFGGGVELHIGDRGEVQLLQETPRIGQQITGRPTSIADVSKRTGEVDLVGIVKTQPKIIEFRRTDGLGRVLRTRLMDGTGRITLVAWNERADELRGLTIGKALRISRGRIKTAINGIPEVHVDSMSQVEILESAPAELANVKLQPLKISQIKANMRDIDVYAKILKVQPPIDVKRATGETTKTMRLLLGDDTGIIQASLWDDKAALDLKEGQTILIEDAVSRERLGEVSLSVGKSGTITVDSESRLESLKPAPRRIKELPQAGGPVIVEGTVVSQPSTRQVLTSKGEKVDLSEIELKDDSGVCRVVFWRDLAKAAAKMGSGSRVRLLGVYPRLGFQGGVELSSGPMTVIEVIGKPTPAGRSHDEIHIGQSGS